MHLDARTYAALLADTLGPDEASALAQHLEGGCERCEAFLVACGEADPADGRVDRALGAVSERDAAGSERELAAIEQRLRAPAPARPVPARPAARRRWGVGAFAAAAAVLVAGVAALVGRGPERPAWDGTKGAVSRPAPTPVRLRFVVVEGAGPEGLRRGASGEAVAARARLEFEVELGRAAHVALARVAPDATVEVFWEGALGPGPTQVSIEGRPAAYRLDGLRGPQRFVAITSAAPLGADATAHAAAAAATGRGDGAPSADAVATDAVEVRVE